MSRISSYTEAPYQGVSQAPPQVRLSTQAELMEDVAVSVPQGAEKRPPFEFMGKLAGHPGSTDGVFELVRKGDVDYALTVTQEAGVSVPRLYPLSGLPLGYSATGIPATAITIEAAAQTYLNAGPPSPSLDIPVLTVEDYTFLLNRKQVVGIQPGASAARPFEALLFMRSAAYARTYLVIVDPVTGPTVTVSLRTPNGKDATDGNFVDTDIIARGLVDGLYPFGLPGIADALSNGAACTGSLDTLIASGFTVTRVAGVVYIAHPTINFTVTVQDGQGGQALTVIKDKVQAFSDLPKKAVNGFAVRIGQQSGSDNDDFFVTFRETAGAGTGVWEESIAPGAQLGLAPSTMPVGLTLESGSWHLRVLPWQGRLVGDSTLAPDPDFVGSTLTDLTFWRGRLGLISSEGVTLSSADDPFRMYPRTLSTVLADDPVSLLSPFAKRSRFSYAIPFEQKLIIWGDLAQAQVTSTGTLGPDTAQIDEFSTYEYSKTSRPQGSNNRLYFLAPRGTKYSAAYEMDINQTTSTVEGDDLSVSVPKYIPANADRIANCPVNYQMVYGVSGDSQITPHLFRYVDKQRVQNAWSKWNLPAGYTYGGGFFVNTSLYFLACKAGVAYILRADLSPGVLDPDPDSRILTSLDMRVSEASVLRSYNTALDQTTVTLPYPPPSNVEAIVRAPGGVGGPELSEGTLLDAPEGTQAEVLSVAGSTVVLSGDWTQAPLWLGAPYGSRIVLSKFYARDPEGSPLRSGRLSLRVLILDVDATAFLKVRVTVGGRTPREYIFEGSIADDPQSAYDRVPLYTGPVRFPIKGESEATTIEILNDTAFPMRLLGYTWEGEINLRASRGVK